MGFDMVPQLVYFPFSNSSFQVPSNIVFKGPKYSPSISWFVSKTTKSYQGTAKTSLYHVHVATSLPKSIFSCWFISLSSETCLTNSISFFLLNWHCDLGRVRILHSRSQHLDRQTPWLSPSQMTSFVCFCHVQSKFSKTHEFLYFAASVRDCVCELHCLAPDGRPALSLVVSEEYFNSKFNKQCSR